jgi:tRNA-specific 2-thiouridylase
MSGGVDSSLAAALLVEAGHEVVGATMKTFCYSDNVGPSKTCCGLDGIQDARRVADHLGIAHYVFDVEEEFTRDVIDDFVAEYAEGRTPNPCVRCNSNTKFRDLMRRGQMLGCDGIATGHYVRIEHADFNESALLRGRDRDKDQAYFLWGLPRELLSSLIFPLGEFTKPEVRARARALSLATSEKPESQEICFVPAGVYREFLEKRLPPRHPAFESGRIVSAAGETLGEHAGFAGFTVGQRKGLGGGFSEAMFVLEIRPESREVVVGTRDELFSTGMQVTGVSWLTMSPPEVGDVVRVQIRHRALDVASTIVDAGLGDSSLELHFAEPQRAVTPGQSAAIFLGDRLLGGGRIARALVAQLRPVEPNPAPPRSLSDSSRTSSISGVS